MSLSKFLNEPFLLSAAGEASYERGVSYYKSDRVSELDGDEGEALADVQGSEMYSVRLWLDGESLCYECDCPVGSEGSFCKHCVAVGLAILGRNRPKAPR
jgi:uncharacterized Zn finger protein